MLVRDKVVVVTGAARGIGEALARRFHAEGARAVIAADLDGAGAEKVAQETHGFGMRVDVGSEADIKRLVDETIGRYGQIDLFCSNAGIFIPGGIDAPDADWLKMRDIHLLAHIYAARAVLPGMLKAGKGRIVAVGARAAIEPIANFAAYSVSKAALVALVKTVALEVKDSGITANAVLPSVIDTPANRAAMPAADASKWVTPESIAGLLVWLVSDAARDVNGAAIPIYGRA